MLYFSPQVHFYKEHHGHTVKYKIPDRFQKFLSTEVMKKSITASTEEEDLYTKFKSVLDSIAAAAYNADTETMKMLYRTAIEMEKIVKREEETVPVKKKMTDKQITETLESLTEKKVEIEVQTETGRDETNSAMEEDKPEVDKIKVESNMANADGSIACFNDSYMEFCNKINEKNKVVKKTPPKKKPEQKNVRTYSKRKVVKTKIGQFKPNILLPRKKVVEKIVEEEIKDDLKDVESEEDMNVDEFELNTSINSSKVKLEVDYEVIEQENDCNILVLKI